MTTRTLALQQLTAPGEPYELIQLEAQGQTYRIFKNSPNSLRVLYEEARSDLTFLVYEEQRLSFDETWQKAARIATLLVDEYGIVKGDRVAISMRNFPEWVLAFCAVTSVGGVAVAMNALWQPDEMAYGLKDSGAKVLFADQERLDRLAQCDDLPEGLRVLAVRASRALAAGVVALEEALAKVGTVDMPAADIEPDSDATIIYTSGSTGHPKGALSSHRNIVTALLSWELDAQAAALVAAAKAAEPDHQLATLLAVPLFHATGSHGVFLASFRAQRRIVCMYKWDVERAAELIEQERITNFTAPAAMTGDLVQAAVRTNRDLSSLATVGGGGAPRAPEQVRKIGATFAKAMPSTGWGMTETNAIGTAISGQDYQDHPDSAGRASAVVDLRVVDENGRELPTGERGELLIRGASVIRGYWQRPDADAETFVDGWLRTGDVAYLDAEGYLFIVDRIKDLVIRGGENIGCGGVESALLEHPDVLEASVYGVPDERLGEEVGATVHVRGGLNEAALRDFLAPRLARFEIPRHFHFAAEPLPRTASGKILKRQLRDEAAVRLASGA